ncbi:hypothetical protein A2797_00260 [candidate division WWE3 bacterium RIFCSPHIGHO2_01_FULL_48_15]|uniref:DUF2207 domain-containing protein n=1 Tax=candidate division WWE3 bacterium RIFCSPHIGHO2_01_FULL_48_15 TaxID=1802619 RepID=A0A1F4VC98_UNCKA|nr:MAG: hypothetical protein A2797_00260 [candidate division WWE3 bacterium RIFCSPHIGHO2_01_FULL_48_15]
MRKVILILLAFFFFPQIVLAQESGWVIDDFRSEIIIPQSGKVQVVETINVDFGVFAKHGIFRSIPTEGIRFELGEVKQDGVKARTDVSSSSGHTFIKIGDPNQTISGKHVYEISYEVGKVITRFDDRDEFYWNVTGDDWEVPIKHAAARITLEGGEIGEVLCFTGYLGSREQDCSAQVAAGKGEFSTANTLYPGDGLTIVNSLPPGTVGDPFYLDEFIMPYWLIFGSFAAILFIVRRWWKHGRDMWYRNNVILNPQAEEGIKPLFAKQTVVVDFEPPQKLRPGEVGTLVDERVDLNDVSATIVDLAVRGYLKIIEEKKKDYYFEKQKDFLEDPDLSEWEKEVLLGIFGKAPGAGGRVALSDLKEKFYARLDKIREKLYASLTDKGYFPQSPNKTTAKNITVGAVWMVAAGVLFYIFSRIGLWWVPVPIAVFAGLLLATASLMPRKTAKGTEAVRRASGFKLFISTAQKYQQQFNERIGYFDSYLPYAMVFGVVGKWVGAFRDLGIEPPQPVWYVGHGLFNISTFSSTVDAMSSSFASTLPSRPASHGGSGFGGGGFSGGGFGGGGGGSW